MVDFDDQTGIRLAVSLASTVRSGVPRSVKVRWPAFEALPGPLRATADALVDGLDADAIARDQHRPVAHVKSEIAEVFARLAVGSRWELARLRRTG